MVGRIVCSKAGRDKGHFMVVTASEDNFVYLCDGKERPLSRPKRKNIKHISFTKMSLDENSYKSDKALRRCLAVLKDKAEKEEP